MADFYSLYSMLTLKSRSRSPNLINSLLCHSKLYIKFDLNPLFGSRDNVQEIMSESPILDISKCQCDLENNVKVTKI